LESTCAGENNLAMIERAALISLAVNAYGCVSEKLSLMVRHDYVS